MICAIVNESKHVTAADVQDVIGPVNRWSKLIDKAWDCAPTTCALHPASYIPHATFGAIVLQDGLDVQGAAGYHDVAGGRPIGRVDVAGTIAAGMSWTVTLTHELAEMKVDPWCTSAAQVTNSGGFVALELCDPVEDDRYAIPVDGVACSDFVWPSYFVPGGPGPYDQGGHLRAAAPAMLTGGYLSIFTPGHGWTQRQASELRRPHTRRHSLRVALSDTLTEEV